MRDAQRRLPYIDDPDLMSYLNELGQRLVANSNAIHLKFRFYWVADNNLNAFAVPGGHITVHTGLILATENESELAGVLAHEIAHISQRHLPRMLAQQKQMSIPSMAAIIAGILLGGQAGVAAIAATNAALIENQLRYSRAFETEADTISVQTILRAGYDPNGIVGFFDKLYTGSRLQQSKVPEFLRTHPLTLSRITSIKQRTAKIPPIQVKDNPDYRHIRAKIGALYVENATTAVNNYRQRIGVSDQIDNADMYGYALALSRAGRHPEAIRVLEDLLEKDNNRRYQITLASIQSNAHDYQAANEILAPLYNQHPGDPTIRQYYSENLLVIGKAARAKPILRSLIQDFPEQALYYEKYARATAELGEMGESHFHLATYFILKDELNQALNHLYRARQQNHISFYQQASIDAKIAEIQQEISLRANKKKKRR